MRVHARRALLVDTAIGVALAVASWMASFYVWDRSQFNRTPGFTPTPWGHGPPGRMVMSVDPSPWVVPAVIVLALGIATRRVWPRAAFVATVVGVGTYLATGATFGPIFLARHLPSMRWRVAPASSPRMHPVALLGCHRCTPGRRY